MLKHLFGRADPTPDLSALYQAIVAIARDPQWFLRGGVADSLDGRFDMLAAILGLVLDRLERAGAAQENVRLTELFVDDMDGQLRQLGIGDLVVGKHVGRMMAMLGGRSDAYRAGLAGTASLEDALVRNLYRGVHPGDEALAFVAARLRTLGTAIEAAGLDDLLAGRLPRP